MTAIKTDLEIVAEYLQSTGVDITASDLEELQAYHWERSQQKQIRLCEKGDPGYEEPFDLDADIGKTLGFVFGAVLGAFFLPGIGLAAGWLGGALIGGAIGQRLVGLFDGGDQRAAAVKSTTDPIYNFSGVGSLVQLGTPIPKTYGNRSINPMGGVYLRDPGCIYSRVVNRQGARYLRQLFILAYGQLGEVNQAGLLIEDKPRTDWETGDITTEVSPGTMGQAALAGIDHYSQAVNISTNAFVGVSVGLAAEVPTGVFRDAVIFQNLSGVTQSGGTLTRTGGTGGVWGGGARSQSIILPAGYGSYLYSTAEGGATTRFAMGLSISNTAADLATMDLAVELDTTTWRVWAAGTQLATGTFSGARTAQIRYYRSEPVGHYQVFVAGTLVHEGVRVLADTMFADYSINGVAGTISNCQVDEMTWAPTTGLAPGIGKRFRVAQAAISKLKSAQIYVIGSQQIAVVGRSVADNWIEFDRSIWVQETALGTSATNTTLAPGGTINTIYRSAVTTSKKVTSIDVVMAASIWAKDGSGADMAHGQAFAVTIEKGGVPYSLGKFIIVNASEQQLIRMFSITGLPKAIYTIKLAPIPADQITAPLQSLEDRPTSTSYSSGIYIDGYPISLSAELGAVIPVATAQSYCGFAGKVQTSGDRGASIQVTHINEIVSAPTPPTYPGYTIAFMECLASDRLQNAPATSWDIPKGAIIPNYLAYGKTMATSGNYLVIDRALGSTILPGDRVRVLGVGEWNVVSSGGINSAEVRIDGYPNIAPNEELVIWRMASSNYFPDIYVDRLINKGDGLGNYIDQDNSIHYESIVNARHFCENNQYYFDGVFNDGSFENWAIAAAPSSLLFATKLEGKYALIPQETAPPSPYFFNDANTISYSEPGVPWSKSSANTLLAKYQNNLGREAQIRIQTASASTGLDPAITHTINTQGVTTEYQTTKVGQVALQSLRLQDKTCQIETDIRHGRYIKQGQIIRSQHTVIEKDWENNGFVLNVNELGVKLSEQIELRPESRITICHIDSRVLDEALTITPSSEGRYQITGLSEELKPGDLWILCNIGTQNRIWRVTAMQPDHESNRVKLSCIKWDDAVLSSAGLVAD